MKAIDRDRSDDKPGDYTYRTDRAAELGRKLQAGDLVYCEPSAAPEGSPSWFDSRRGKAPGFDTLRAELAQRGLEVTYLSAYYWEIRACPTPTRR